MRILGIDFGTKRIGFAVGDTEQRIAFPRRVVETADTALRYIEEEIKEGKVEEVVIGIPIRHSGEEGELGKVVREFADEIKKRFGVPVHLENEILSTKAIQPGTVKRELTDAASAALILQGYLNRVTK